MKHHVFSLGLFVAAILFVGPTLAQEEDDESRFAPGLVARYSDGVASIERIESNLGGWTTSPAVAGLRPGSLEVTWRGYVLARPEGQFRFHALGRGHLQVRIDGSLVLDTQLNERAWSSSTAIELLYGWRRIDVRYRHRGKAPELIVAWNGPGFEAEPLTETSLFHDASTPVDDRLQRGLALIRDLRCQACHLLSDEQPASKIQPAPDLTHLNGNLSMRWLQEWLSGERRNNHSMMPQFDLSRQQARHIARHLFSLSNPTATPDSQGDVDNGRHLFLTVGCLACHRWGDLQSEAASPQVDLTRIGEKRSKQFFELYLENPQQLNSAHQMPVMELPLQDRRDLVEFLATLGNHKDHADDYSLRVTEDEQGKSLVDRLRCANCHRLAKTETKPRNRERIPSSADWSNSCLTGPDAARARPGYALTEQQRAAIRYALAHERLAAALRQPLDVQAELRRRGCISCHARGTSRGMAPVALRVVEEHPQLAPRMPALVPPSLNRIGEKLLPSALAEAVLARGPRRRPWLAVRMPRYSLTADEVQSLVQGLTQVDRFPPLHSSDFDAPPVEDRTLVHAGTRLVSASGFGCTSCHPINGVQPPDAPLNARGPDLGGIDARVRSSWFERWVRNPNRIVPRIEMPAIEQPVGGVLAQDLDAQLHAVWHVLNQPAFRPPPPHAVRVVRRSGVEGLSEHAIVLTDVLDLADRRFIKPFFVALPNRHNMLFDLQSGQLAAWTIGDAAIQRTQGKSWFWQSAGTVLMPHVSSRQGASKPDETDVQPDSPSEVALIQNGKWHLADRRGQFVTQADRWLHLDDGVRMDFRLHFKSLGPIRATQSFQISRNGKSGEGWRRTLTFSEIPVEAIAVRVGPPSVFSTDENSNGNRAAELSSSTQIRLVSPTSARFDKQGWVRLPADENGRCTVIVDYLTRIPVDKFPVPDVSPISTKAQTVDVVPGFAGRRLPVGHEIMPTGMGWLPNGSMVITSLKGRVWIVGDSDGDGIEDSAHSYSDELAAPFGVVATDDYVDVINKYALLRLFDQDHDQHAERVVTLAAGWGHTDDYHDWAVGLPRDANGSYFVGFACQQDDRSPSAARLRGRVVRLDPMGDSTGQPMSYSTHVISAGHRFPIGIALSAESDLFVTDNQGNYNPYNELNHVRSGAHFGFINKLESHQDEPRRLTPPAIKIPHPWTRSVNGICFLASPKGDDSGGFGPFEGHLVGCEYDTRRLVRLSLQRVGDTYQGAVYPLSVDQDAGPHGFLGPVTCAVSPEGDLYIGDMRESGWGGGQNVGAIVRLTPKPDEFPPGIAQVRATAEGFEIHFTHPIDPQRAANSKNYIVSSVTRQSTPDYGGEDKDRRLEVITDIIVSTDNRRVDIQLETLRAGHVYEFHLQNLTSRPIFHPAEAYYTLNVIPPAK